MEPRLTPYFNQLIYDACLKAFWRRRAFAKFLRDCGVPDRLLALWSADETKRDLLDKLFDDLPRSQSGQNILLKMAQSLIDMKTFPDLANWEDSALKIKEASEAVERLRRHHRDREEAIRNEADVKAAKDRFREHQEKVARSHLTLQGLNDRLNSLGTALGTMEAGYAFQDWFYDLADFSEVTNRRPYVDKGRQIDGTLTVSGTTYLVELKFTGEQAGSPDIDSLYKKVTSKADNTMGIMVSISGYSSVAKQEASGSRTPLLLLDHGHVYLILGGVMSLSEIINRIRRHASQTGDAYLPPEEFGG